MNVARSVGPVHLRILPLSAIAGPIAVVLLAVSPDTRAADVIESGDLTGRIDTTVSFGASWRVQDRDRDLIARANGGGGNSPNVDDGNLNYDKGLISVGPRFVSEMELDYHNLGFFMRANGFLDFENDNGKRDRTELGEDTKNIVGGNLDVLDFYGRGAFDIQDHPLEVRAGKQVVSWGESTFIPNGINVINPVDVSKLRTPGAELRDALLPVPIVSFNFGLSESISLEGFWQYDWDKVTIDPNGTFFSSTDLVGTDARRAQLGFGNFSDRGSSVADLAAPFGGGLGLPVANLVLGGLGQGPLPAFDSGFQAVARGPDRNPDDNRQFGFALRVFAEQLASTEFGLYFVNYHSRLPIISARTADLATTVRGATVIGVLAGGGVPLPAAAAVGVSEYAKGASYFVEYPEDIKLYGLSFNTQIGTTGWALQGEYSYKQDVPFQVDDVELLFAALTPLDTAVGGVLPFDVNQLGEFGIDTEIPGFITRNVSQIQLTASRVFANVMRADQLVVLGEVGVMHVHGMPSKSRLRLQASGTDTSGDPFHSVAGAHVGLASEKASDFPDATSWGYRLAARWDFLNAVGAVNLSPRVQWQHDVNGISPGPGGPFEAGRKAVSLGLRATYLEQWAADLSWTTFFGGGRHNLLNDRDFVAASLQYSF